MNPLVGNVTGPLNCLTPPAGDPSAAACSSLIKQTYQDAEIGLTYTLSSGVYVGGTYRVFDYDDDVNGLVDYDGNIFTVLAGSTF
jgi:hypothetical protein